MNPINALFYYTKCHAHNVNQNQLPKLTEKMLDRMFDDNEIGLWADFWADLQLLKPANQQLLNINPPNEQFNNYASFISQINNIPQPNLPIPTANRNIAGNPNSLLSIISTDQALYNKAINSNKDDTPKTLTSTEQGELLSLIKRHFVKNCSNKMSYEDMELISNEIQRHFPGEDEATYYKKELRVFKNPTTGEPFERVRASGKLVSKWNNRRDKDSSRSAKAAVKSVCYTMPIPLSEIANKEAQEFIRVNLIANQNYPLNLIIEEWRSSRPLRFQCINDNKKSSEKVFQYWPTYGHADGHILVSFFF